MLQPLRLPFGFLDRLNSKSEAAREEVMVLCKSAKATYLILTAIYTGDADAALKDAAENLKNASVRAVLEYPKFGVKEAVEGVYKSEQTAEANRLLAATCPVHHQQCSPRSPRARFRARRS